MTGIYYLPRIIKAYKKGDAAILKKLIDILALEKIKVIRSTFFTPELSLKKGNYTKDKPTKDDLIDIKRGENILKKTNAFDHIQAIIVKKNSIFNIPNAINLNFNQSKSLVKSNFKLIKKNMHNMY